ncbi:hypothetical protein GCM10028827_15210 [Mucilaginibacter myungsuensis]
MHHVTHEVVHALTHADKGFLYMIKELATQPGITIKEFLAGKHKKFFNPFSFFFIVLGIYVLSNSFFRPFDYAIDRQAAERGEQAQLPPEYKTKKQKERYIKIQRRLQKAMNFMNTKTNIVLCLSTPIIAFIMFLMYRRTLYYAEHLVTVTFINSFLNLLSIFIFTPLTYLLGDSSYHWVITTLLLASHVIYTSIAYFRVLDLPSTAVSYIKCVLSVIVAIFGWTFFWFLCILGYVIIGVFVFH